MIYVLCSYVWNQSSGAAVVTKLITLSAAVMKQNGEPHSCVCEIVWSLLFVSNLPKSICLELERCTKIKIIIVTIFEQYDAITEDSVATGMHHCML